LNNNSDTGGKENEYLLIRMDERLQNVQSEIHTLRERFDDYVLHVEFKPVKLIAFGMAGLILCSVIAAIVASVIK